MQNKKADNKVYAGFFVRLAAYIVDMIIVSVALLVVRIPVWISTIAAPHNFIVKDIIFDYSIKDIVFYLLKVTYFVLLTYYTGSTLGKKLFHLRVVSTEERKMTFFEVAFRETVGRFLSSVIIYVGYIMIDVDKEKRGLHDLLSDTSVVYYHEKKVYTHAPVYYRNMTGNQPYPPVNGGNIAYNQPQPPVNGGDITYNQPQSPANGDNMAYNREQPPANGDNMAYNRTQGSVSENNDVYDNTKYSLKDSNVVYNQSQSYVNESNDGYVDSHGSENDGKSSYEESQNFVNDKE